jgi:protein ImuB
LSLRIGLFQPTSCPEHLLELFKMQLDQLALPGPVESLRMEATVVAPLERRQTELFSDGIRQATRQLACLVNRLSSRLGYQAVSRPRLVADAQPELSYFDQPLTGRHRSETRQRRASRPASAAQPIRPLYLRRSPLAVEVVAVADGPPVRLHINQCQYTIARHWGPERIETAWWRGRSIRRDYYRIETSTGNRFWLFRQLHDGRWFLQGAFG